MKVVGTGRSAGGGVVFEGDGDGGGVLICPSWAFEKGGGMQTNARVRLVGPPIGASVPMHSRFVRGSMNMIWKPSLMGTAR